MAWQSTVDGRDGLERTVRLWTGGSTAAVTADDVAGFVTTMEFERSGRYLALGHVSGDVTLWDLERQTAEALPTRHRSQINAVAFSPDGVFAATGDSDGVIILWDLIGQRVIGQPVDGHDSPVLDLGFRPERDGLRLISVTQSSGASWIVDSGAWVDVACNLVNRTELTEAEWAFFRPRHRVPPDVQLSVEPRGQSVNFSLVLADETTDVISPRRPEVKGAIFKLFEDFVESNYGPDAFEELIDATELETDEPFVGPGNYPPGDLLALVGQAVATYDITVDALLRAFGRHAFPSLARSVPTLLEGLDTPHAFLSSLETVIHTEVRKLDPEANPARFTVTDLGPAELLLRYESPFGLFALVEGFLEGVGDWYRVPVDYALEGTDGTNATFRVRFSDPPEHASNGLVQNAVN